MEQTLSRFLQVDWTSPAILPVLVALLAALLAKVGVITSRNYKAVCIAIAVAVGICYAASVGPDSSLSIDRRVLLLFVQGLFASIISWGWLYMVVYGQFRPEGPNSTREKEDVQS